MSFGTEFIQRIRLERHNFEWQWKVSYTSFKFTFMGYKKVLFEVEVVVVSEQMGSVGMILSFV